MGGTARYYLDFIKDAFLRKVRFPAVSAQKRMIEILEEDNLLGNGENGRHRNA